MCITNCFYVDHLCISIDAVPPKNKVIWLPGFSNLCGKIWVIVLIYCLILLIYAAWQLLQLCDLLIFELLMLYHRFLLVLGSHGLLLSF